MIKRVFELTLGGGESAMYYCTLCNRPFKALHEATEHAKFCGQAVPIQPTFKSYTTAATFELEDDVPMPTLEHEAMSRASSLISRAKLTDKQRKERIEKYFPQVYRKPWQGLTDDEYQQILIQHDGAGLLAFYNLVEAKLKEKNT